MEIWTVQDDPSGVFVSTTRLRPNPASWNSYNICSIFDTCLFQLFRWFFVLFHFWLLKNLRKFWPAKKWILNPSFENQSLPDTNRKLIQLRKQMLRNDMLRYYIRLGIFLNSKVCSMFMRVQGWGSGLENTHINNWATHSYRVNLQGSQTSFVMRIWGRCILTDRSPRPTNILRYTHPLEECWTSLHKSMKIT